MRNIEPEEIILRLKKKIKKLENNIRHLEINFQNLELKNQGLNKKLKESQTLSRCLREKTDKVHKENRNLFLALINVIKLYGKSNDNLINLFDTSSLKYVFSII